MQEAKEVCAARDIQKAPEEIIHALWRLQHARTHVIRRINQQRRPQCIAWVPDRGNWKIYPADIKGALTLRRRRFDTIKREDTWLSDYDRMTQLGV